VNYQQESTAIDFIAAILVVLCFCLLVSTAVDMYTDTLCVALGYDHGAVSWRNPYCAIAGDPTRIPLKSAREHRRR